MLQETKNREGSSTPAAKSTTAFLLIKTFLVIELLEMVRAA